MAQTIAVEFQRKLREYQHQAQREPVEITQHGRRELVLMSADHRIHRTTGVASVVVRAVRHAQMHPEHADLDDLLT